MFLNSCYYCTSIILLFVLDVYVVMNKINLVSQICYFNIVLKLQAPKVKSNTIALLDTI